MIIKELREQPEFKEIVIEWLNDEFGNDNSRHFYQSIIEHSMVEKQLPITFIALEDGKLLGTAGIWRGDLLSRQDLFPWFSALVVNPQYRNRGIGKALQDHVMEYAKNMAFKDLYLYTDLNGYYEKNQWTLFDTGYEYFGDKMNIYKHEL